MIYRKVNQLYSLGFRKEKHTMNARNTGVEVVRVYDSACICIGILGIYMVVNGWCGPYNGTIF